MAETLAAMKMLASTEPPIFLSPSQQLAGIARTASAEVFSSLVPSCPKPPLDRLLVDDGFDAEQIWQQIELLSSPLLSSLRRELKRLQREPPSMLSAPPKNEEGDHEDMEVEDGAEEAYEEEDDEEDEGKASEERDEEEEEEEEEEDADDESEEVKDGGVEDMFLKIKELEEYLEKDEAREYGAPKKKGRKSALKDDDSDNSEDEDDEDEDQNDFNFADLEAEDDEGEEEANGAEDARYEDFFGSKKKRGGQKAGIDAKKRRQLEKVEVLGDPDDMGMDSEWGDDIDKDDDGDNKTKDDQLLSIHEKQLQNIQAKIEQMEKENLETKSWTMQGEITAAKRPKNSALEVNLDFDHKARPPPVITDEITASLEDLIRRRIIEGHFDDVQRSPALPLKAPKELKQLDEKKSQKGLAEIYEEEYAQKTGLAPVPLSSDEQKKEASILFKRLCLKLDALSHFHFAPKPVIEDMSVQVNVPALAMEEIAPLAVSDSAMLAPEEVFQGKGDIKEAAELTQAERKRRRANKRRKFKVETAKRAAKKPRELLNVNKSTGSKDL
ncbi:U3 small nucleolar ribonucleoprotein complex subunit Mpp10 protein [Dioscorea alata]|uniref:U3 small nucleolar ribonucleoprotein complex subunit Mpp10 protein n=1 Tax=Dioscorea alata TaxID=55571 RepID=A0ACB7UEZ3_DIOAL|nr:U3 small nucleolar ribonucleoprotein complex subunit Mpp10 protein [Dioscorea alata]